MLLFCWNFYFLSVTSMSEWFAFMFFSPSVFRFNFVVPCEVMSNGFWFSFSNFQLLAFCLIHSEGCYYFHFRILTFSGQLMNLNIHHSLQNTLSLFKSCGISLFIPFYFVFFFFFIFFNIFGYLYSLITKRNFDGQVTKTSSIWLGLKSCVIVVCTP